jgi:Domain of unknown function (DUF4333)
MRTTLVRTAVLLSVAVLAVGCSKTLNGDQLKTELESQLNSQLGATGITVECPEDIKAKSGGEFDCTGTVPDTGTITIHVTQTDNDGHVTWKVVDATTGPSGASASGPSGPSGSS